MAARFAPQPTYASADVPVPTNRPPQPTGTTIRRAKTLTRPERSVAPVPLINPQSSLAPSASGTIQTGSRSSGFDSWRLFAQIITFWAPSFLLSSLGGLKDKGKIQAWREKIALCFIIAILCFIIGFITVGTQKVLCPETSNMNPSRYSILGSMPGTLSILGIVYNVTQAKSPASVNLDQLTLQEPGQDITPYFYRTASQYHACQGLKFRVALDQPCISTTDCPLGPINASSTFTQLDIQETTLLLGYDWDQVAALPNYFVIDGAVLNMNPYMTQHPSPVASDPVDLAIRTILKTRVSSSGKDGTRLFYNRADILTAVPCLYQRYYAGNIAKITPGCFVSSLFLYVGLIVILALVLVRFAMACVFNWFLSTKLAGAPDKSHLNRSAISPAVMPGGANISVDNRTGTAPWAGPHGSKKLVKAIPTRLPASSSTTLLPEAAPVMSLTQIGAELFSICLVTCYSEGEDSIRSTLDSISRTTYSDARKLLFVVADGMITGAGEKMSTPDICVGLLDADPRFGNPTPMSYLAIGSGTKRENRAMVYAGHYTVAGRRTPTVIVVKCGTEAEATSDKKPGNRGKRDSQLILMNFFSRVTYNDRMTPLDFDLFRKIHTLMGVTPDFFEVCLMVDADTKVYPESLKYLVNCMHHDQMIMGVCGETRIANKRDSWVTAIQVFEYFISHHLAKAFESVFGGVSCLPGCFSMFRLKARKMTGDDWIPLIVKPEIVREYSQSEVTTLHQQNLLLLGEDRFLTTILLRTFPNRKMMFLPQAKCRTVVPDTFKVLLSQRRRWINSTIHNLMELVLVRNLCGTFCFSMQFVVFMDLLGTVVLPIAIVLTYALIVGMIMQPPTTFEEAIPLMLLVSVLGLPAVLILITTRKVVYVFWMIIYLVALPVWNFVLPVYAFWHFDDFSWGETRKVEGETKGEGHGAGSGTFDGSSVPLRRWEDWERSRLRKLKREERRRRDFDRMHPAGYISENDLLSARSEARSPYGDGSDTYSFVSSEDDHYGPQIGGYNENNAQFPAPPAGLLPSGHGADGNKVVGSAELEAMLESGFDDDESPQRTPTSTMYAARYQLSDNPSQQRLMSYASSDSGSRTPPVQHRPYGPRIEDQSRTGEKYGPLGPLGPGEKF
ncbi:glycosyltransferase family 2 protein [Suillus bovinus]|uniref:glycosyltransferase family 2 protein n=1 Tax=Suillus bovinus TaxID=48563 RepID=UPI001B8734F0|nr:glycosyltransferase family 2 protein [Suillus bovinus]KAG2131424.1 glycosyltransferase family 2 protein [Suillus bovinus]